METVGAPLGAVHLEPKGMEGLHVGALEIGGKPVSYFLGGIPIEGQDEDPFRGQTLVPDQVSNFGGDYHRLAGASAGEYQGNILIGGHGLCLFIGESVPGYILGNAFHQAGFAGHVGDV